MIPSLRDLRNARNMIEEAYEKLVCASSEYFPKAYAAQKCMREALSLVRQGIEEREEEEALV